MTKLVKIRAFCWNPTLLASGADPSIKDNKGHIPLHDAVLSKNRDPVDALVLHHKGTVNTLFPDGRTPLLVAVQMWHTEITISLLAYDADPTIKDQNGRIPLHSAVYSANSVLVDSLLAAEKRTVNIPFPDGHTPLHVAAERGHKVIVASLLKYGADPNGQISLAGNEGTIHISFPDRRTPLLNVLVNLH